VYYSYIKRPDTEEKNDGVGGSVYANFYQELMWKVKLNCYGGYFINAPYSLYEKKRYNYYYYGLSLSRSWLKQDRLTVRVSTSSPFPIWRRMSYYNEAPSYSSTNEWSSYSSKLSVSVSYRFGSLNAYVKKARKSISNDDLQGGGGGGSQGGSAGGN
ncbi:MAG: outer membrane beta-barrel protein, partial [Muribaculaceae bacterium]|nr:outer membrane beta-barrel protein [Muribaculaceae bacterium]